MKNTSIIPAALFLTVGLIISSYILGIKWVQSRSVQFVTVKGLSERQVTADKAWWSINSQYGSNSIEAVQERLKTHEDLVVDFLTSKGFSAQEIKVEQISVYRNQYRDAAFLYNSDIKISITTDNVELLEQVSNSSGELIEKGILMTGEKWSSGPKYYYTNFTEIKPEMLAEATQEAKIAAEEFARNSGSKVGKIKRANQGIFQILPANRTNEGEEFFKEKIIRVVTTVEYFLK